MAIQIEAVLGPSPKGCRARVRHGANTLEAEVAVSAERASSYGQDSVIVELGFEQVDAATVMGEDCAHGIFAANDKARVVGRVHNVVEAEGRPRYVDLYLENEAEFLLLDEGDLHGIEVRIGSQLAVVLSGLCFYPTNT